MYAKRLHISEVISIDVENNTVAQAAAESPSQVDTNELKQKLEQAQAQNAELQSKLEVADAKHKRVVADNQSLRERLNGTAAELEQNKLGKLEADNAALQAELEAAKAKQAKLELRNQLIGKVADVDLAMMIVGDFVEDGQVQLEALLEKKPILRPKQEVGAMLPTGSGNSSSNKPEHSALATFIKGNTP